jgi:hypothetical protein
VGAIHCIRQVESAALLSLKGFEGRVKGGVKPQPAQRAAFAANEEAFRDLIGGEGRPFVSHPQSVKLARQWRKTKRITRAKSV